MTTISIRNNFPAIAAKLDRLPENIANKALVRALNHTIDQGKTEMARRISSEYRLSVAKAKERLSVRRAYARGGKLHFEAILEAKRRYQGRSMNLIHFVEDRVSLAEAKRRAKAGEGGKHTLRHGGQVTLAHQVRFQIKRTGGAKIIPGAFIANMGRTVFIREGKGRLPIKPVNTIDVPQMFNGRRINTVVRQVILDKFQGNFRRELRVVLEGWAK